jgi:muramoyltetrapeptide carboxypeptidase
MQGDRMRIGIVAPAGCIAPELAEQSSARAAELYGDRVSLKFHPQCFLSAGHFAGDDDVRARAFLDYANDDAFDAIWFAKGGYGSGRIVPFVLPGLSEAARRKTYLGYSDLGSLMGPMYANGFARLFHGPMPADLARKGGDEAFARGLSFLVERTAHALEPSVEAGSATAAFNLTIFTGLIGTPYEPDLSGHVLMIEEVAEHLYRIDRMMMHLARVPGFARLAGLRLGRCSAIPDNDPDFGADEIAIVRHWCAVAGVPYLGRADIGHDIANKVVPFGRWRD